MALRIRLIAEGAADLACAFLESLPCMPGFHGPGMGFPGKGGAGPGTASRRR